MKAKYTSFNSVPYESHMLVFKEIAAGSKVLDMGCASGYFARELKKKNCRSWGVDNDKEALKIAKKYCEEVALQDLDQPLQLPFKKKFFDDILLLDVLEHLKNPELLLEQIKPFLGPNGKMIISVPNIAFISIRLALLRGKWQYVKTGIMDESHLRFFTKNTLTHLIDQCGYHLDKIDVASGFSQITLIGKYLNKLPKRWQYEITRLFPTLLGYQFIAIVSLR